jgi:hypothetical protein
MRNALIVLILSAIAPLTVGCERGSPPQGGAGAAPPATAATTKHAAEHATPGSHEDWCEEHQVPESMCTRCNPSLVAAFKATSDWCEEHGLPESQCRICNPNLTIERPPRDREGGH